VSKPTNISFVLRGKIDGIDLTPRSIGLSQFNEFNRQVEEFIAGSKRLKLDETHIEVAEGSYKLIVGLPLLVFSALQSDLRVLSRQDSLGEIDPKRQEVITKWQARSKQFSDLAYEIVPLDPDLPKVRISRESDFRVGKIVPWVSVEKYLRGEVVDMGGAHKANVHLRLDSTGELETLSTSQGYLQEQVENRLYRKVLAHVRAEQHYKTGELRRIQLVGFVDYSSKYDEAALDLFAAKGREAWSDIHDAATWVRELRGGV
jgi:hypothetical protein